MSHHKPDPNKSVNLTIDGIPVTVPEGTRILEAAKKANVHIPVLCEHPDLCKRAVCRICVVECDGRGKLIAACANDVWEGVNVVTANRRLLDVRRTILELILASHPQDCLSCARNKNCELQSLAAEFGIRSSPFDRPQSIESALSIESETIVRDMDKCVKCGRCVEECQEVQNIRAINTSRRSHEFAVSAPYKQALSGSSCVFCGQCASVCPVGAIYEYDQSAQVLDSLYDSGRRTIAQFSPAFVSAFKKELSFSAGTVRPAARDITAGKLTAALKLLGFDMVFDGSAAYSACKAEQAEEAQKRGKTTGKPNPPVITGCSQGVSRFVNNFYPDLADHLLPFKDPRTFFADTVRKNYAASQGLDEKNITAVSFVPCIAQKYPPQGEPSGVSSGGDKAGFALTPRELARLLKLAGIDAGIMNEEPFNTVNIDIQKQGSREMPEIVCGFAQAREIMESIRKGECTAKWIEIHSCQNSDCPA